MKIKLTEGRDATAAAVTMKGGGEQFNGREGETATLFVSLSVSPHVAWWRFRPTSSQPLDASLKTHKRNVKNNEWLCAGRKDNSIVGGTR